MYTPDTPETISEVISVGCVTTVALLFGRKVASIEKPLYYIRGLLLSAYAATWIFSIIACMANSTNSGNPVSCRLSLYNWIFVYTIFKMSLYLYFMEKIYIISVPKAARLQTPLYLICAALLVPYIGLIVLQVYYHTSKIDPLYPYHCKVGVQLPASASTLGYDVFLSLLYTAIFVKYAYFPSSAQKTTQMSSALRSIARRSIIATVAVIFNSAVNYCVLIALNGIERGLVSQTVCSVAATLVVCIIHWVSNHPSEIQCTKALHKAVIDYPLKLEIKQHQEVVVLSELAPPV